MDLVAKLRSLRRFNFVMFLLHLIQGVAIIFISRDFRLPVTTNYLSFDIATKKLTTVTTTLFEVPFAWLVVIFLFLSSLAHLIISTVFNKRYNEDLKKGINRLRWFEYSLSASTMMVAIAMLVGIYDLGSLLMIFSLVALMNLMGLMMEIHNQTTQKTNWTSFIIGCFAGIIPWVVVGIFFWAANYFGLGQIPTFVYAIYGSIFVFFNCFAINMVLQYKKVGKWKDYLFGEKVYVILSLVAKSALAWQVFAGTLRP
ncbi:MAG: heliorhodopsin HeR [Caldiserica bacterium]|jgi:ABC-type transport system involved in cytochrome bd biosynthesis fused ATPase/permease subunit|nr:heliorhodopsin HeR [Caldisericota bacterium]MDH7562292.1 heliorhodopsin HeR [Caldisericota bacterium]